MKILGIETSCDETAAAIVENGGKILGNVVASSKEVQQKYGGIVPEKAAREQIKAIIPVIKEALFQYQPRSLRRQQTPPAEPPAPAIDAIAVTVGPGLIGSLLVGVETAKTLAYVWQKPIIPVNHLVGHIYSCFLNLRKIDQPKFPSLVLIVSGGHTELILVIDHGRFKKIGSTRDDAAGEAFDKTARLLNLGYPGGGAIAAAAEKLEIGNWKLEINLPRPMIHQDNLDFSFSGLKTAVFHQVMRLRKMGIFHHLAKQQLAFEVQEAITDVLVNKTIKAAAMFKPKSILVCGGVAANQRLRQKMTTSYTKSYQLKATSCQLFFPPPRLATDNAAAIASCAYFNYHPLPFQKISANPNLMIR